MRASLLLSALLLATATGVAHGDIIFDGGLPNPGTGLGLSDLDAQARQGDDFTLTPGASTIAGFRWYGTHGPGVDGPDNFTIAIYPLIDGMPGASPSYVFAVGAAAHSPDTVFGTFVYEVQVTETTLAPNVPFVLSIYNHTPPGFEDDWAWYTSGVGAGFVWLGSTDVLPIDRDFAFAILGPVPAPGTAALGALLLATIGRRSRR